MPEISNTPIKIPTSSVSTSPGATSHVAATNLVSYEAFNSHVLANNQQTISMSVPGQAIFVLDITENKQLQQLPAGQSLRVSVELVDQRQLNVTINKIIPPAEPLAEVPLSRDLAKKLTSHSKFPQKLPDQLAYIKENSPVTIGQARRLPHEMIKLVTPNQKNISAALPSSSRVPLNQTYTLTLVLAKDGSAQVQFTKLPPTQSPIIISHTVSLSAEISPKTDLAKLLTLTTTSTLSNTTNVEQTNQNNSGGTTRHGHVPTIDMSLPKNQLWLRHQPLTQLMSQLAQVTKEVAQLSPPVITAASSAQLTQTSLTTSVISETRVASSIQSTPTSTSLTLPTPALQALSAPAAPPAQQTQSAQQTQPASPTQQTPPAQPAQQTPPAQQVSLNKAAASFSSPTALATPTIPVSAPVSTPAATAQQVTSSTVIPPQKSTVKSAAQTSTMQQIQTPAQAPKTPQPISQAIQQVKANKIPSPLISSSATTSTTQTPSKEPIVAKTIATPATRPNNSQPDESQPLTTSKNNVLASATSEPITPKNIAGGNLSLQKLNALLASLKTSPSQQTTSAQLPPDSKPPEPAFDAITKIQNLTKQLQHSLPGMRQLTSAPMLPNLIEQFVRFDPLAPASINLSSLGSLAGALQLLLGGRSALTSQSPSTNALSPELATQLKKIVQQGKAPNKTNLLQSLAQLGNFSALKSLEETLTSLSGHLQLYQYQSQEQSTNNQQMFYFTLPTSESTLPQVEGQIEQQPDPDDPERKTWQLTLLLPIGASDKLKASANLQGKNVEIKLLSNSEEIVQKAQFFTDFLSQRLVSLGLTTTNISCKQAELPKSLLKRPNQLVELMI